LGGLLFLTFSFKELYNLPYFTARLFIHFFPLLPKRDAKVTLFFILATFYRNIFEVFYFSFFLFLLSLPERECKVKGLKNQKTNFINKKTI